MRALHTFTVATELPDALQPLSGLARNLGWVQHDRVRELFARVDPPSVVDGFEPVSVLASADPDHLAALADDPDFVARAKNVLDELQRDLDRPRWFQLQRPESGLRSVAYFSPEFGIAESLPQYSGGLGILAGDHLKAANDLGIPLTGIGLFYRHGYFRQSLDRHGWQHEAYPRLEPRQMALSDTGVMVEVDLAGVRVRVRVWKAEVGTVELYLLDTDVDGNDEAGSTITDRLYGGSSEQRIRQEIILGIGGVRALRALGHDTQVFHMNEGHAGFLGLERIREHVTGQGMSFGEAIEAARSGTIFTTHTPVPAGIDRFGRDLVERYFGGWAAECGVSIEDLLALGHEPGTAHGEVFNLACMGLRLSERSNGVAKLHGAVSREMFSGVWPDVPVDEVPIGHVTNGVHARSWTSGEMSDLLDRRIGSNWPSAEPDRWDELEQVSDAELWAARRAARQRLVTYARRHVREALVKRGHSPAEAAWADTILDPDALTIGFARRFATYKRASLLLSDKARLRRLLLDRERPVQFLFAGKAHPADEHGKRLLQLIFEAAADPDLRHRIVLLDDYDIAVGRAMYHGVDVWLNTPRRPMEACGTSGMKVVFNGALNLSILDGWWDEMYEPRVGWAIPSFDDVEDVDARDLLESQSLLAMLEDDVVPSFYARGVDGNPGGWLTRVRDSIRILGPKVTASRMLRDYVDDLYVPAANRVDPLLADGAQRARDLAGWKRRVLGAWSDVAVRSVWVEPSGSREQQVGAEVALGGLDPADVRVQVLVGRVDADDEIVEAAGMDMTHDGDGDGVHGYRGDVGVDQTGTFGLTVRVVPAHPDLAGWSELGRARFAQGESIG
ncbi:MAG: alpha-glucan family phosphorylase [Actinomycetota bacterium]